MIAVQRGYSEPQFPGTKERVYRPQGQSAMADAVSAPLRDRERLIGRLSSHPKLFATAVCTKQCRSAWAGRNSPDFDRLPDSVWRR